MKVCVTCSHILRVGKSLQVSPLSIFTEIYISNVPVWDGLLCQTWMLIRNKYCSANLGTFQSTSEVYVRLIIRSKGGYREWLGPNKSMENSLCTFLSPYIQKWRLENKNCASTKGLKYAWRGWQLPEALFYLKSKILVTTLLMLTGSHTSFPQLCSFKPRVGFSSVIIDHVWDFLHQKWGVGEAPKPNLSQGSFARWEPSHPELIKRDRAQSAPLSSLASLSL